jgi:integrase
MFMLASSGARVTEMASIRYKDLDTSSLPVSIHLRPEVTKTRIGRIVYISNEAKEELQQWLSSKQRSRNISKHMSKNIDPNELVFQVYSNERNPKYIVHKIQVDFIGHLKRLGLYNVREGSNNNSKNDGNDGNDNDANNNKKYARSTITLHSFRKLWKVQSSLAAGQSDIAEYIMGHIGSMAMTYFKISPTDVAKIYLNKIMEHVTFCDIASVEKAKEELNQKLIEERDVKDRELGELKKRLSAYENKLDSVVNRIGDILGQADTLKQKEYLEAVKSIQNK